MGVGATFDWSMTFGERIQALRHGFHCVRGCFLMRISGDGPFRIDLRPNGHVPGRVEKELMHRIWWSKAEDVAFYSTAIKPIIGIVNVKRPITFLIDDNGELVK